MTDNFNLDSLIRGRVDPYIYAFETNTVPNFLKVGDTYRPVEVRLNEWRKKYSNLEKKYEHIAKVDENTYFRDYSVHDFLMKNGFRRIEKNDVENGKFFSNEFFKDAKKENVDNAIKDIQKSFEKKDNRYVFYNTEDKLPLGDFDFKRDAEWTPRDNQKNVINKFKDAYKKGRNNLLMFAVMRFGKSFTSLCCAKAMDAKLTVVVCGKTAVRLEWKENVQRPKIFDGFEFLDSDAMSRNPAVISENLAEGKACVVFLTMQDLLGEDIKTRHADLFNLNNHKMLDLLIIDETHFGARAEEFGKVLGTTEKKGYDESFDELENQIKVFFPKVKLHLSGTPYRILLDKEFETDDIVGMVQYSDIINEKEKWDRENIEKDEWENPYYGFPQMIRFVFNLNESAKAKLADLKNNGYSYDLDELFSSESTSKADEKHNQFKNKTEVLDLLRAIDGSKEDENIFSFLNYDKIKQGSMCRHIVMVLPYCASCDAMENLLKSEQFNNLNDYEIINIAGFDAERIMTKPDYAARVKEEIEKFETEGKKTISLTVGKMLTGSTVKEWDTMIFLRNTSSPQDYDQAIFRLQSQYVKKIKSDDGKIIKQDMKPQTILVDFDPVRMYALQHKKSLIANINKAERGNEVLEANLKRELEIAPIIFMNHSKLGRVEAQDIVDIIRNYNANKSMMDETFDIEIDQRIFEDEAIRSIIERQPEITAKGIKFDVAAYGSEDDDGDDIDIPDTHAAGESKTQNTEKADNTQNEEDDNKKLASKLQGYYFKLLLFAFISEKDEKSVSDIIANIENDTDGKRIGKHLQINEKDLKLIRDKINPQILSYLEDKIQNINQLGKEITPEKIGIALKKMSRLSVSEVVTPDNVAKEVVNNLPNDISAKNKFLDIASKTGEFANALLNKYGEKIKNNIYSVPTSGVTYECTRKIYKLLGMPEEHIYSDFTSYDLIDTSKNKKILKELKEMNFDAIMGNPPYQVMDGGAQASARPIYNEFVEEAQNIKPNYISIIMPTRWYAGGKGLDEFRDKMLNDIHIKELHDYTHPELLFPETNNRGGICFFVWDENYDNTKLLTRVVTYSAKGISSDIRRPIKIEGADIFIRNNEAISIIKKVFEKNPESFENHVSSRKPFGLDTTFVKSAAFKDSADGLKEPVVCYGKNWCIGYIEKELIISHKEWVGEWKLFAPYANNIGTELNDDNLNTVVGGPNTICTESYLLLGINLNLNEISANNLSKYTKTKFLRALHSLAKVSQHATAKTYRFVPLQDFTSNSDIDWSKSVSEIDKQLYKKYNLSAEEISFIESKVREM